MTMSDDLLHIEKERDQGSHITENGEGREWPPDRPDHLYWFCIAVQILSFFSGWSLTLSPNGSD